MKRISLIVFLSFLFQYSFSQNSNRESASSAFSKNSSEAFDIPEKFKKGRDALRWRLKKSGFRELQKSILIATFGAGAH